MFPESRGFYIVRKLKRIALSSLTSPFYDKNERSEPWGTQFIAQGVVGHKELTSICHYHMASNNTAFCCVWNVTSTKITALFLSLRSFSEHKS